MGTNDYSKKPKQPNSAYIKYSGFAVQFILTILIAAFGGRWLDGYFKLKVPVFLLVFILLAIGGMLYKFIREVIRDQGE